MKAPGEGQPGETSGGSSGDADTSQQGSPASQRAPSECYEEQPPEEVNTNSNAETQAEEESTTNEPQPETTSQPKQEIPPEVTIMSDFDDDDSDDSDEEEEPPCPFRPFTKASYVQLLRREEERKRVEKERKDMPQEGRLVDGELKFGDEDDDEPPPERDLALVEGNTLPVSMDNMFPAELLGKPVEEIDKYLKDKVGHGNFSFFVLILFFVRRGVDIRSDVFSFDLAKPWSRKIKYWNTDIAYKFDRRFDNNAVEMAVNFQGDRTTRNRNIGAWRFLESLPWVNKWICQIVSVVL